jgi:hypothetical protein
VQDRLFRSLLEYGIQVEDLGGDVQAVRISALKVRCDCTLRNMEPTWH